MNKVICVSQSGLLSVLGVHYNSEDEELMLDIEPSPENDDYVVSHQKVLVDNFRNSSAFQKYVILSFLYCSS